MGRIVCPAFLDPSNTTTSITASCSRAINEYLETPDPGHGKSPLYSLRTPGIRPVAVFPAQPILGLFTINDRSWVVGGAKFAEMYADYTFGELFDVAFNGTPASMCSNGNGGHQVMVITGNKGYIFDTNDGSFSQITAPGFPTVARMGEFMDGYFIALWGQGANQWSWSALEDGLSWDALDTAQGSITGDNIGCLIRNHKEIWLFGGQHTEVWFDQGDRNTVFAPLQGVLLEHGINHPFCVARCDNTLIWCGLNVQGQGMVWRADGYTPKRISTFAVEAAIQRFIAPQENFRAWTYQLNGHLCYVLFSPSHDTSWVYDVTMDRWHEWAHWDTTTATWFPHVGNNHIFFNNKHLVGDRFSGAIYELSQDFTDDQIVAAA